MRVCVLMGSPRLNGNTAEILKPFMNKLKKEKVEVKYITLADKNINPCKGCYACQEISLEYGCVQKDDMQKVVESIIWADVVVLATPIYTWYCTAQMKCVLDRFFGMNKYYRGAKGTLWGNKKIALVTTNGYEKEYGAGPFEIGIKRFCEHAKLSYLGMYSVRDINDIVDFQTEEVKRGAEEFAEKLIEVCN